MLSKCASPSDRARTTESDYGFCFRRYRLHCIAASLIHRNSIRVCYILEASLPQNNRPMS